MTSAILYIIFGKQHLDYRLTDFVEYYNTTRSHMERDSLLPVRDVPDEMETLKLGEVETRKHVGGLVTSVHKAV